MWDVQKSETATTTPQGIRKDLPEELSWLCALKNALTTWRSDRFVKGKEQQKLPNANKRKKGINKILDLYNKQTLRS